MSRKKTQNFQVMGDEDIDADTHELECMDDDSSEAEARAFKEVMGVFRPNAEFDRAREEANAELIQLVAQFMTDNPSLRFGQALNNLGLLDNAPMAEPQDQLKRARKILRRMKR